MIQEKDSFDLSFDDCINVIDGGAIDDIKMNGVSLPIDNKSVNIPAASVNSYGVISPAEKSKLSSLAWADITPTVSGTNCDFTIEDNCDIAYCEAPAAVTGDIGIYIPPAATEKMYVIIKTNGAIRSISFGTDAYRVSTDSKTPNLSEAGVYIYQLLCDDWASGTCYISLVSQSSDANITLPEKQKLAGIAAGAEVNAISSISLNGVAQEPDANKNVNISALQLLSEPSSTGQILVTTYDVTTDSMQAIAANIEAIRTLHEVDALEGGTHGELVLYNGTVYRYDGQYQRWDVVGRLPAKVSFTLLASGWSNNAQTITVSGYNASENTIQISPSVASYVAYRDAGAYCSAESGATLTFTCTTVPSADIVVEGVVV